MHQYGSSRTSDHTDESIFFARRNDFLPDREISARNPPIGPRLHHSTQLWTPARDPSGRQARSPRRMLFVTKNRQYAILADEDLMSLMEGGDAEVTPRSQPSEAFAETWRNRQREQIREALNTLPTEQLKILELAYFSGYTHVEISNLLDLPLGTVKGRMRLGLKKIREYFDQENVAVPRCARWTTGASKT